MKTPPILLWLLLPLVVTAGGFAAEEKPGAVVAVAETKKTNVKAEMSAEIKRQFPFLAKPDEEAPAEVSPVAKSEVVVMNTVKVTASYRGLDESVEHAKAKQEAETFNWAHGGTYYKIGNVSLKLKYNPRLNKMELISIKF